MPQAFLAFGITVDRLTLAQNRRHGGWAWKWPVSLQLTSATLGYKAGRQIELSLQVKEMNAAFPTLRKAKRASGAHPASWDWSWTGEVVVCRGSCLKGVFHRQT